MAEVVINGVHRNKHNLKQNDFGSSTNTDNNNTLQHSSVHPLHAADKFYHPYEPYDVQLNLMKSIYDTIDNGYKLGLFESPTGTGKTLSIICSTMTWLRIQRQKENATKLLDKKTENGIDDGLNDDNHDNDDDDDDEPDWVKQAYREKIIKNILTQAEDYERHLQKLEKEGSELITNELEDSKLLKIKKRKFNKTDNLKDSTEIDENNCIPDNYDSDEEYSNSSINKYKNSNQLKLDSEIKELLFKLDSNSNNNSNESIDKSTDLNESNYKVFFSSRTHSQLDQFADQLKLIENFPSSLPNINEKIKYLPLGSRKQLCINEEIIQNYTNINDINDACLNLQKNNNNSSNNIDSQKKTGCKYYINNRQQQDFNQKLKNNFRDLTFSSIHDIEDLNKIEKY
ncbi:unnamed protein product [[Candida] boidinii]|nr:unnamed protein product [[Candida] boidinii]